MANSQQTPDKSTDALLKELKEANQRINDLSHAVKERDGSISALETQIETLSKEHESTVKDLTHAIEEKDALQAQTETLESKHKDVILEKIHSVVPNYTPKDDSIAFLEQTLALASEIKETLHGDGSDTEDHASAGNTDETNDTPHKEDTKGASSMTENPKETEHSTDQEGTQKSDTFHKKPLPTSAKKRAHEIFGGGF